MGLTPYSPRKYPGAKEEEKKPGRNFGNSKASRIALKMHALIAAYDGREVPEDIRAIHAALGREYRTQLLNQVAHEIGSPFRAKTTLKGA